MKPDHEGLCLMTIASIKRGLAMTIVERLQDRFIQKLHAAERN